VSKSGRLRAAALLFFITVGFATLALGAKGKRALTRERIDQAASALAKKNWPAVVEALESALDLARDEAPLELRKVVVTRAPAKAFGIFEPISDQVISDRELWLYVEVAGFGSRVIDSETHEVDIEVSAEFSLEDGTVIGTQSLGAHRYRARSHHRVTFFAPHVSLSKKAPEGTYLVELRVKDAVTNKLAKQRFRFIIPR
jgi:hypothetical protein